MKKLLDLLLENILTVLGILFSIFGLSMNLWGGGNPQNAIAWVALLLIWCLNAKTDGDRKRAKEIKKRLDILAGALLPVLCKGDSAIKRYNEILKKEDIPFILFEEKGNEVQNKD